MAVTKKIGRPAGSKNKPKDPMIAAVESSSRARNAARRAGRKPQTVEEVRKAWAKRYNEMNDKQDAMREQLSDRCNRLYLEVQDMSMKLSEFEALKLDREACLEDNAHLLRTNADLISKNKNCTVIIGYLENLLARTYDAAKESSNG